MTDKLRHYSTGIVIGLILKWLIELDQSKNEYEEFLAALNMLEKDSTNITPEQVFVAFEAVLLRRQDTKLPEVPTTKKGKK